MGTLRKGLFHQAEKSKNKLLTSVTTGRCLKGRVTKGRVTKDSVTKDSVTKGRVTKGSVIKGMDKHIILQRWYGPQIDVLEKYH